MPGPPHIRGALVAALPLASGLALAHKAVALYLDLLLHDMGSLADGIAQGDARMRGMRTMARPRSFAIAISRCRPASSGSCAISSRRSDPAPTPAGCTGAAFAR